MKLNDFWLWILEHDNKPTEISDQRWKAMNSQASKMPMGILIMKPMELEQKEGGVDGRKS